MDALQPLGPGPLEPELQKTYDASVLEALGDVACKMARYGNAGGIDDFATREIAESFQDALSLRYPPQGYGTWTSRPALRSGRWFVEWRVDSCE